MRTLLTMLAAASLIACGGGGGDEPLPDERKNIIPVVCTSASGVIVPGNCYAAS